MKKTKLFLAATCFLLLAACKKEIKKINEVTKNDSGTGINANKLIGGGGNSVASIACGVPIGVTKDLKVDFGAVGDGIADDSPAFLKATDWINANWSLTSAIELYIPTGVYKVGVQIPPGGSYNYGTGTLTQPNPAETLLGFDMLKLTGVENVYIHGDPGLSSQIIYKNGLYYGGMSSPGSPCNYAPACISCAFANEYASVGNFISLKNCKCITIDLLSINGNAQNCQLMGLYGECNGYQLAYDGINIINGNDITISNTDCINFGRDGLMTRFTNSNPKNITLTNLNCVANCRQGFSFTAGDNITANNCNFNNSGSIFYNNPGCGMDIEPESGGVCINSTFTNCKFKDNAFVGMISDDHFPNVSGITFSLCEFSATVPGSWSIWPKRMSNTVFTQCTIRGRFTHVAGTSSADKIFFQLCNITDWNGSFSSPVSGWNSYLMNFGWAFPDNHYYTFGGCNFDIHHSLLIYTIPGGTFPYGDRQWEANNFVFHYADLKTAPAIPGNHIGRFVNSSFTLNKFTETAPVSVFPPNPICYWFGLYLNALATNPNENNVTYGGNVFLGQDGVGGNPWTRVYRNGNWLLSNGGNRNTF